MIIAPPEAYCLAKSLADNEKPTQEKLDSIQATVKDLSKQLKEIDSNTKAIQKDVEALRKKLLP